MRAHRIVAACLLLAVGQAAAKDLSAETMTIVHDVMQPYRGASPRPSPNVDPAAVKQALDILKKERLVDVPRPQPPPLGIADKLGRALAMGQRTRQFLPEIGAVRDALVHQDESGARAAIQQLYAKMGRSKPTGKALDPLYDAARKAVGEEPQETERVIINRPDYRVIVANARAAGEASVQVLMNKGPDGKPARVEFSGDVKSAPNANGDLSLSVVPAASPTTMTSTQAAALRARINGKWRDQNGTEYEISGSGSAINLRELRSKPRDYRGTFDLGLITARFAITKPDDIGADLPLKVRQQLAGMGLHFDITLNADAGGSMLDGTWASQHVTYSAGGLTVSSVHDPFDTKLTLTREAKLTIRFTDAQFVPLEAATIYAMPSLGVGTGEVWIEARAARDDATFEDGRVDTLVVTVTSDVDKTGRRVNCVETGPATRIFRSQQAVMLRPEPESVSP